MRFFVSFIRSSASAPFIGILQRQPLGWPRSRSQQVWQELHLAGACGNCLETQQGDEAPMKAQHGVGWRKRWANEWQTATCMTSMAQQLMSWSAGFCWFYSLNCCRLHLSKSGFRDCLELYFTCLCTQPVNRTCSPPHFCSYNQNTATKFL